MPVDLACARRRPAENTPLSPLFFVILFVASCASFVPCVCFSSLRYGRYLSARRPVHASAHQAYFVGERLLSAMRLPCPANPRNILRTHTPCRRCRGYPLGYGRCTSVLDSVCVSANGGRCICESRCCFINGLRYRSTGVDIFDLVVCKATRLPRGSGGGPIAQ